MRRVESVDEKNLARAELSHERGGSDQSTTPRLCTVKSSLDFKLHTCTIFEEALLLGGDPIAMLSTAARNALRQARGQLQTTRTLSPAQHRLLRALSTLAVLEQREGKLQNGSLSAVTAAKKLGGSITGFVAGSSIKAVADEAAKVDGVEKILVVENGSYDKGLPENYAPLLVENIKKGGFTHVIAPHSAFGKNLMPRVAALLDSQQISDITAIEGEDSELP